MGALQLHVIFAASCPPFSATPGAVSSLSPNLRNWNDSCPGSTRSKTNLVRRIVPYFVFFPSQKPADDRSVLRGIPWRKNPRRNGVLGGMRGAFAHARTAFWARCLIQPVSPCSSLSLSRARRCALPRRTHTGEKLNAGRLRVGGSYPLCINSSTSNVCLFSGDLAELKSGKGSRGQDTASSLPEMPVPSADPDGRYKVLAIHTSAVVLGLATWFSATAVR